TLTLRRSKRECDPGFNQKRDEPPKVRRVRRRRRAAIRVVCYSRGMGGGPSAICLRSNPPVSCWGVILCLVLPAVLHIRVLPTSGFSLFPVPSECTCFSSKLTAKTW